MNRLEDLLINVRVFDEPEHLAENRMFGLLELIQHVGLNPKTSTVVEIGAYSGTTSELFSLYAKEVKVYNTWKVGDQTPDNLRIEKAERLFDEVVTRSSNVKKFKCETLLEGLKQVEDNSVDVLYLSHLVNFDRTLELLREGLKKVKPGGYLTGHALHHPEASIAVVDVLGKEIASFHDYSFAHRLAKEEVPAPVQPIKVEEVIQIKPVVEEVKTTHIEIIKSGSLKHN